MCATGLEVDLLSLASVIFQSDVNLWTKKHGDCVLRARAALSVITGPSRLGAFTVASQSILMI